jgi:glycosyltransferase involved in cell wall biosynthesis
MKRALIATLFNEADNVSRWWGCLMRQTVLPDEIVIVDGSSKDGTWEKLQELARQSPMPVKLEQRRCNIAAGRNRAIQLTDADIIAATDAGSFPENNWFDEITRPLMERAELDVVAGRSVALFENDFQKFLAQIEDQPAEPRTEEEIYPSSRNVAFRRQTWSDVGGYPEWLTLTAEDSLFNFQIHTVGKRFFNNPKAEVCWPVRDTARGYFKMLYGYGYGAAEARLYAPYYWRRTLIAFCPPSILFSRRWGCRHFVFRYQKNLASARGWLAGRLTGHRPPPEWQRHKGVLLSPQAQTYLQKNGSCTR